MSRAGGDPGAPEAPCPRSWAASAAVPGLSSSFRAWKDTRPHQEGAGLGGEQDGPSGSSWVPPTPRGWGGAHLPGKFRQDEGCPVHIGVVVFHSCISSTCFCISSCKGSRKLVLWGQGCVSETCSPGPPARAPAPTRGQPALAHWVLAAQHEADLAAGVGGDGAGVVHPPGRALQNCRISLMRSRCSHWHSPTAWGGRKRPDDVSAGRGRRFVQPQLTSGRSPGSPAAPSPP